MCSWNAAVGTGQLWYPLLTVSSLLGRNELTGAAYCHCFASTHSYLQFLCLCFFLSGAPMPDCILFSSYLCASPWPLLLLDRKTPGRPIKQLFTAGGVVSSTQTESTKSSSTSIMHGCDMHFWGSAYLVRSLGCPTEQERVLGRVEVMSLRRVEETWMKSCTGWNT